MLRAFLLVGAGGFFGSMARYGVSQLINKSSLQTFPLATLFINLAGCMLIGLLFGLGQRNQWMQHDGWLVLATGFCGGFTTFSAFALENSHLLSKGQSVGSIIYIAMSVVAGILLCKAGIWLASQ